MTDMTNVIKPKSDQLNSDDLIAGPITITITDVSVKSGEQPVSIRYQGDNGKPYKPCKSMCRVLVKLYKADAKQYVGKSITLYNDPEVTWGGMKVGGIRISHASHINTPLTMALTQSKSKRSVYTVQPLTAGAVGQQPAGYQFADGEQRKAWLAAQQPALEAMTANDQLTEWLKTEGVKMSGLGTKQKTWLENLVGDTVTRLADGIVDEPEDEEDDDDIFPGDLPMTS